MVNEALTNVGAFVFLSTLATLKQKSNSFTMKKLLFTLTLSIGLLSGAFAQNLPNNPVTVVPTKTTLTNTDTATATANSVKPYYKTLVFTVTVTKATGTLAGSVLFQGTLDGTNYVTITTTALTDGANVLFFREAGTYFNQYRVRVITSGTSTSTVSNTKYLYKQDR